MRLFLPPTLSVHTVQYVPMTMTPGPACDHDIVVGVEAGGKGVQEPLHVGQQVITNSNNSIVLKKNRPLQIV